MSEIDALRISLNEVRSLVLEVFKNKPFSQYLSVCNDVAELAVSKGIVSDTGQDVYVHYGGRYVLRSIDQDRVREIIWNLIFERVLTIGINANNSEWPWLKLTEYGQTVVTSEMPAPVDEVQTSVTSWTRDTVNCFPSL